jgi:protein TonB
MRHIWIAAALLAACAAEESTPDGEATSRPQRSFETPVVVNAESPIGYPRALYEQRVEGTVVLRLFVDDTGAVVPDSTQVAEASGYPALDSAALAGVAEMRFAPAQRDGQPVATSFLQPVHFRLPDGPSGGGS